MRSAAVTRPTEIDLGDSWTLRRRTPLFDICASLAVLALVGSIASRKPEIIALGAPFLVAVAASLATWRPFDGGVRLHLDAIRVAEGDTVTITVEIATTSGLPRVEVELEISERLVPEGSLRAVTTVAAHSVARVNFAVRAEAWGIAEIDRLSVRLTDRLGMFTGGIDTRPAETIRVGLPEDRATASLQADHFRRIVGSHLSNDRGEGLEIADIRAFQPGDSTRQINWRISNRRQEPWITLRHPDRSTTIVIVVDAHEGADAERQATQRRSVAVAVALTRGHLAIRDRVGLLVVGHTLAWLPPKLGRNQLHGVTDELIAVSNAPEASRRIYRPTAVASISKDAIVVAVSPLSDPLMVALIAELRSRGNTVSVLMPTTPEPPKASRRRSRDTAAQSRRLAAAEQAIGVQSLRERGVAIVSWDDDESVTAAIQSLYALRLSIARARSW